MSVSRLRLVCLVIAVATVGFTGTAAGVKAAALPNWGQQNPAQSPAGRAYAAMDYDSRRGRAVLFGGDSNPNTFYTDTWEWDGSNWSTFTIFPPAVSPPPAIGPGMAYDSARGVSVLLDNSSSTWEWNGSTWVKRTTASAPPSRFWTAMAYDALHSKVVMFGGSGAGAGDLGDTWTYNGTTWTNMSPVNSPSPRFGMAMAFDSARGVTVLFGGRAAGQRLNDTWEWDGTNWTQRAPATSPYPRFWHSMAFDTQLGETVMFGGDHIQPFSLGPENDTWLWDGTSWTRDWTAAAPSPRAGQTMAYESATGRALLFGGTDELQPGVFPNDTWELGSGIVTPAGSPTTSLFPTSINFGSTNVGTTSFPAAVNVSSSGTGPLVFSSIAAAGAFGVASTDCPIAPDPLAAGAYCRVLVDFVPTACGFTFGSLNFADNAAGGQQAIALQGYGNVAGCDADLQLVAPLDVTVNATSPAGAAIKYPLPAVVDEDLVLPVPTCDRPSGSTFPIGTTLVTCQVTDPDDTNGTVSTSFRVTVNDTDLALTGVPVAIAVSGAGPSGTVVTYTQPTAVDEDLTAPPVRCTPASGSTFPIGSTTVTCLATDSDDTPSTVTATFQVTVNDTDLGLSGVPTDITVNATSPAGAAVSYVAPSAVDEDPVAPAVTCNHPSGTTFPIGATTVTCTVLDPDDLPNTVSATFHVTVNDTDLELVGVPASTTVNAASPSGATVSYVMPTALDEDAGAPTVNCDHVSGSTFAIGTTTVTCHAADPDDTPNTVMGSFQVTVRDTDLALIAVPADITAVATDASGAAVTYTAPTEVDEDATAPAVNCDHKSGAIFPVGTATVTCVVTDTDDTPSTVSATFHVTVIPDLQLVLTISPTSATSHTTVTSTAAVTNLGAVSRKATISYMVTFTDSAGTTTIVASDKATVTVDPGQTVSRPFFFAVKNTTSTGTYLLTVNTTDITGSVTQTSFFTVT